MIHKGTSVSSTELRQKIRMKVDASDYAIEVCYQWNVKTGDGGQWHIYLNH